MSAVRWKVDCLARENVGGRSVGEQADSRRSDVEWRPSTLLSPSREAVIEAPYAVLGERVHTDGVGADSGSSMPSGDATAMSLSLEGSEDTVLTKSGSGRWLASVLAGRASVAPSNSLPASVRSPVEFDLL